MPNRIVFYPPTNSLGFLALLIPLTLGLSVVVLVITVSVSVIVVAIAIVIMVMTKQCARGRRHRFFGNVYRGVECLAGGFERVKWGTNGVTGHPKGILDHFICKALVIPVMTVMSAADSDQRGHHSE